MVRLLYYCFFCLFICLGNYEFSPHTVSQDLNRKRHRAQRQSSVRRDDVVEPSTATPPPPLSIFKRQA